MSDSGLDGNLIPDDTLANYEQLRLDNGWTWEQLAEQFDRDAHLQGHGYEQLADWARDRGAEDAERAAQRAGTVPQPATPQPPGKRDTRAPRPGRTAA